MTILVATDFSETAANATAYAAELAARAKARLVLFHAFHLPVITSEVPLFVPPLEDEERTCMEALQKTAQELSVKHGYQLKTECRCSCGFAAEEIVSVAREVGASLVVVGMQGQGSVSERVLGSVATELVKRNQFPILIINRKVKFRSPKRIALACDFKEAPSREALEPMKALARIFKSSVYVLHVTGPTLQVSTADAAEGIRLEHELEGIEHAYHFVESEYVTDGISTFVRTGNIDLVVMVHHDRNLFARLFHPSNTRHIAFHTEVPLLALRGQTN
jgi:nucleotide-binding universal stress UspA family protein